MAEAAAAQAGTIQQKLEVAKSQSQQVEVPTIGNGTIPGTAKPEKIEHEEDAGIDKRARMKDRLQFNEASCTPGSLISHAGTVLSTLQADGRATVLNGGCLNVGLLSKISSSTTSKGGRYYVELKFLDTPNGCRLGLIPGTKHGVKDPCESFFGFDVVSGDAYLTSTKVKRLGTTRAMRSDVVGLLINLDDKSENRNTISTFINGKRGCEPLALPDFEGNIVFPVVFTKGSAVSVNCSTKIWKPLPFHVRMLGDAAKADVEQVGGAVSSTETEFVMLCGVDTADAALKYVSSHGAGEWRLISGKAVETWAERSSVSVQTNSSFSKASLVLSSTLRPGGKHLFAIGQNLNPAVRKEVLERIKVGGECVVKAIVSVSSMDNRKVEAEKGDVEEFSLPSKEEGFAEVVFEDGTKAQAQAKLDKYKATVKLRQRVDIKPGDFFKTYLDKFATLKKRKHKNTAAKNTPEGETPAPMEDFGEEDWVLAQLRADLHALAHAFRIDVDNEEKQTFPTALFVHYYHIYSRERFYLWKFGCNSVEELVNKLVNDTVEVDEEGFLKSKLPQETSPETLLDLTEKARRERRAKLEIGDDSVALKFHTEQELQLHSRQNASNNTISSSNKGAAGLHYNNNAYNNNKGSSHYNNNNSGGGGGKGGGYNNSSSYGGGYHNSYHGGGGYQRSTPYGGGYQNTNYQNTRYPSNKGYGKNYGKY